MDKLNGSHQCFCKAKKANNILAYISKSTSRRSREVTLPLYLVLGVTTSGVLCPVLALQCKKDMDILERIQSRSTKVMFRGLEHMMTLRS